MSIIDRHYHLLRRLHSLSGVFPVGLFLLPHLTTNSSIVWGRLLGKSEYGDAGVETFQHEVDFIHSLPALEIIEWTVLFGPIAFHAILGVIFARSGKVNVDRYGWNGSWRYALQRMTGYLAVAFIFLHITSLHWLTYLGLMPKFDTHHAAFFTSISNRVKPACSSPPSTWCASLPSSPTLPMACGRPQSLGAHRQPCSCSVGYTAGLGMGWTMAVAAIAGYSTLM